MPIFGILTLVDSKSPNFWIYAGVAFWIVELFVIFCLDLFFIRTFLGQGAWTKWQQFWGENKTHWVLAGLSTAASAPFFIFLLLTLYFGDNMSKHDANKFSYCILPAVVTFCGFAFGHSIFRDRPTASRGSLTYGCFALLLLILGIWNWA